MNERTALIALAHIVEPGDERMGMLVDRLGAVAAVRAVSSDPRRMFDGPRARLRAVDATSADECAVGVGARLVTRVDADWPKPLDDLGARRPFALWVRGSVSLSMLDRSIAVVGARASTAYGEAVCRAWSSEFVASRYAVVSGGAFGIDAVAHRAVLAAGGVTACVLAGGVDVAYPRAHEALIGAVAEAGLVISESPPGSEVRRQRFLTRNRIIAAMTRATIVVEAAWRSGTASTAHAAAELTRPICAVPGPVTSPASAGCHRLIADGVASIALSAQDVIAMAGPLGEALLVDAPPRPTDGLTYVQARLLDSFPASGAVDLSDLQVRSGLALTEVAEALSFLVHQGAVTSVGSGWMLAGRG